MSEQFLTPGQLSKRWDGRPSVNTLNNWRSIGRGPKFVKFGRGIVKYPISEIETYEKNIIKK